MCLAVLSVLAVLTVAPPAHAQSLTASDITETTATLTISGRTGGWYYQRNTPFPETGICHEVSAGTDRVRLTGLLSGRSFQYLVYYDNACTGTYDLFVNFSTTGDPVDIEVTPTSVLHTSATLKVTGHFRPWYYKYSSPPGGACSQAQSGETAVVTGLERGTTYTFETYWRSGCVQTYFLDNVQFTTHAAAPALAYDVSDDPQQGESVTLTLDNYIGDWSWRRTEPTAGPCRQSSGNRVTDQLVPGPHHTWKAYSDRTCRAEMASVTLPVQVTGSDSLLDSWLSRFGRSVASQTVDAVSARLALPPDAAVQVTLGGRSLPVGHAGTVPVEPGFAQRPAVLDDGDGWPADGPEGAGPSHSITGRELLVGSSFHIASGGGDGDGGVRWVGWGGAGVERFRGRGGGVPVRGEVVTGVFGADRSSGRWLTGVALSFSRGEGELRSEGSEYDLGSTMTAVNPYVRFELSESVSVWGLAGWGRGNLTLTQRLDAGNEIRRTDISMTFGAFGGRAELMAQDWHGGFDLALKGDAFLVRTKSDAVEMPDGGGNLLAASGRSSRVRVGLEGSRLMQLDSGATLTPSLEVGLRHDGGDAETGAGVDVGVGLAYSDPSSGLSAELRARTLALHSEGGYREWGISAAIRLAPDARDRGPSASLTASQGPAETGTDVVWSTRSAADLVPGALGGDANLDAEVGYGTAVPGTKLTGTPYLGLGTDGEGHRWRLGWRLTQPGEPFRLSLDADRREGTDKPAHGIGLNVETRW